MKERRRRMGARGAMAFMFLALPVVLLSCQGGEEGEETGSPSGSPDRHDTRLGPKDGHDLRPTELDRVAVGMPAPDFTLPSLGGDLYTLSDFRNRKDVILVFYRGHW